MALIKDNIRNETVCCGCGAHIANELLISNDRYREWRKKHADCQCSCSYKSTMSIMENTSVSAHIERCDDCGRITFPNTDPELGGCSCPDRSYFAEALMEITETNKHPYRSLAIVEKGQKHGLLFAPKPIPPHVCNPPGFWVRLRLRLAGKRFYEHTLYRCRCGQIFEWMHWSSGAKWERRDNSLALKDWLKAGGVEK